MITIDTDLDPDTYVQCDAIGCEIVLGTYIGDGWIDVTSYGEAFWDADNREVFCAGHTDYPDTDYPITGEAKVF